jgi:hypothetical protein
MLIGAQIDVNIYYLLFYSNKNHQQIIVKN